MLANRPRHFGNIKDISFALPAGAAVPWSRLLCGFKRAERLRAVASHASSILSTLMVAGEDNHPVCPALRQFDIHEKDDGYAVVMDKDEMVRFLVARILLRCAITEVTTHRSGGGRTWRCGDLGDRMALRR